MRPMQDIFIVIGVSQDTIILNQDIEIKPYWGMYIMSPEGLIFNVNVMRTAGPILEVEKVMTPWEDSARADVVPIGSLGVHPGTVVPDFFFSRYKKGLYNDRIVEVMKAFAVESYNVPKLPNKPKGICML